MSDERQKEIDDAIKRIAVVGVGGGEAAGKVAAMLEACDLANEGSKRLIVLEAEPPFERGRAKSSIFLSYMIHSLTSGYSPLDPVLRKLRKPKPTKPCAECGEMHSHNNLWCSTECCRTYRQKEEEGK